jgi:hypothetical protein
VHASGVLFAGQGIDGERASDTGANGDRYQYRHDATRPVASGRAIVGSHSRQEMLVPLLGPGHLRLIVRAVLASVPRSTVHAMFSPSVR